VNQREKEDVKNFGKSERTGFVINGQKDKPKGKKRPVIVL
jgi:hypothetical protein